MLLPGDLQRKSMRKTGIMSLLKKMISLSNMHFVYLEKEEDIKTEKARKVYKLYFNQIALF